MFYMSNLKVYIKLQYTANFYKNIFSQALDKYYNREDYESY